MTTNRSENADSFYHQYSIESTLTQSSELTQFYNEINHWIDRGCLDGEGFRSSEGLCCNLYLWARRSSIHARPLISELEQQFKQAGLINWYPFNSPSRRPADAHVYMDECKRKMTYKNQARLDWIKSHATSTGEI